MRTLRAAASPALALSSSRRELSASSRPLDAGAVCTELLIGGVRRSDFAESAAFAGRALDRLSTFFNV